MKNPAALHELSSEQLETAKTNLERCLDARDQRGEAGLQEELARIHPATGLEAVTFASGIHGTKMPTSLRRVTGEAETDRAKLEADRLAAQLNAPLSRDEQLRKLKKAPTEEQPDLFGGEPARTAPGGLDGRLNNGLANDGLRYAERHPAFAQSCGAAIRAAIRQAWSQPAGGAGTITRRCSHRLLLLYGYTMF